MQLKIAVMTVIFGGALAAIAQTLPQDSEYLILPPQSKNFSFRMGIPRPTRALLNQEQVANLQRGGYLVERNQVFFPLASDPSLPTGIKTNVVWPLALIQADKAHTLPQGKGEGVRICMIDTGIDQTHPGLRGTVLEGRNFISKSSSDDLSDAAVFLNHGTKVAQVIVGQQQAGFEGVAPAAKLIIAKVFDENGATMDKIIDALGYCMNRADIINMSFGGDSAGSKILSSILNTLKLRGVTIFAAAGNNGGPLVYPAWDSSVSAVGVVDQFGKTPFYSAFDSRLGFVAPGHAIPIPDAHGNFTAMSGSSFAAAIASGIEAIRRSRGARQLEFRDLGIRPEQQGRGLIDALLTSVSL